MTMDTPDRHDAVDPGCECPAPRATASDEGDVRRVATEERRRDAYRLGE